MESSDPREHQASPRTDFEASMSSASGKAGKMPSQGGEIMDIDYFSDHAEGKKKRRRGRLIIFVDESEERTRWVPWVLLAAVIVGAVVAAVVIIRFAVNNDDGTRSSASKLVNLDNGKLSRYQDCASMMARLRQTSQAHDFSPETAHQTTFSSGMSTDAAASEGLQYTSTSNGQHGVLVPLLDEAINLADDPRTAPDGDGYMYVSSATQLKVLSVGDVGVGVSEGSVVATYDFSQLAAFQVAATLVVSGASGSVPIDYGLGSTFRIEQLFLPPAEVNKPRLLAVVGSATNAAPVFPGPSPQLKFGPDGPEFVSPDLRPFNTTVLVLVDISNPLIPTPVTVSEFEGQFVTIDQEGSHFWLFLRTSAHIPADHGSADDSELTTDIMPLFRNLPIDEQDPTASSLPWLHMGDCSSVARLDLGVPRAYDNYLLAAISVQAPSVQPISFVEPEHIHLFVQGWATGMVPVLTAKTSDWLNLYLAEGIRFSMQPTVPSAASTASIITAVSHFRLSGGNMTFNNYTTNDGELRFQGTMHFLEDPPQLSLLTSKDGESSTGSALQSSLTIYSTSLSTEYTAIGQYRGREPTGVVYPSDDHVFISFSVKTLPLIQVVPIREVGSSDPGESNTRESRRAGASDTPQQSVQRLLTAEYVDLMKAVVVSDPNRTNSAYVLLVAGGKVPSTGNDAAAAVETDAQYAPHNSFQFSLYSYTPSTTATIQTLGNSTHITNGDIKSEAFLDPRAAMLFRVPGDVPGHVYFALPVVISSQTDLISDLDCSSTKGFSGTLVWRLAFDYTARSGLGQTMTTQRLAAIPAWGSCGFRSDLEYDDVAVKRIRLAEADDGLQLVSMSRCMLATVPWSAITQPANASVNNWRKIAAETEQLFSDDCSVSAQ